MRRKRQRMRRRRRRRGIYYGSEREEEMDNGIRRRRGIFTLYSIIQTIPQNEIKVIADDCCEKHNVKLVEVNR